MGSTSIQTRSVCTHTCTDGCYGVSEPDSLSAGEDSITAYNAETPASTRGLIRTHVRTDGTETFDYAIIPQSPDESASLLGMQKVECVCLVPDLVEAIDLTEAYLLSDIFLVNNPEIPHVELNPGEIQRNNESMQNNDSTDNDDDEEPEFIGFTLTIVVKGEDGMALGNMLPENTMKPNETYVIHDLIGGELFILAAGPHCEEHFVFWEAFYTDDIEQRFVLNSQTSEPPASAKLFIMPEANITIVIEFTDEEPEYPDEDTEESDTDRTVSWGNSIND